MSSPRFARQLQGDIPFEISSSHFSNFLSPFCLMESYIKTHCITLLFCYGTFKWGSFFKPSCLAIKRVKSASEAAKKQS